MSAPVLGVVIIAGRQRSTFASGRHVGCLSHCTGHPGLGPGSGVAPPCTQLRWPRLSHSAGYPGRAPGRRRPPALCAVESPAQNATPTFVFEMERHGYNIEMVAAPNAIVGEGPVRDWRRERLLWTDIRTGRVFDYDPASGVDEQIQSGVFVVGLAVNRQSGLRSEPGKAGCCGGPTRTARGCTTTATEVRSCSVTTAKPVRTAASSPAPRTPTAAPGSRPEPAPETRGCPVSNGLESLPIQRGR